MMKHKTCHGEGHLFSRDRIAPAQSTDLTLLDRFRTLPIMETR